MNFIKHPQKIYHPNKSTNNTNIKLYSLNVGGLATKFDLGVLDLKFLDCDIVCLMETKMKHYENCRYEGYKCYPMSIKNDLHKYGGVHGICVYIRNGIFSTIEQCNNKTSSDCTLWVKLTVKNSSFYLGIVYIPHENSKYYHNDLFDNLIFDIATLKGKDDIPFVLCGDFNSRTGLLDDFMEVDLDELGLGELQNNTNINNLFKQCYIPLKRSNQDVCVNKNGEDLTQMCKITDLKILNGRVGKDKNVGKLTCMTGMGQSCVDYCIASPEFMPYIIDFSIDSFDRCLSDTHCGLNIEFSINETTTALDLINDDEDESGSYLSFNLKWDETQKNNFISNFDESQIDSLLNLLNSASSNDATQNKIDSITNMLKGLFINAAHLTGFVKEIKTNKRNATSKIKNSKPWFDHDCIRARKNYTVLKNKLQRNYSTQARRLVKAKRIEYSRMIKTKKKLYIEDIHNKLKEFNNSNPKEFWRIIQGKKEHMHKIDMEQFRVHFAELNKSEEQLNPSDIGPSENLNEILNEPFTSQELKLRIKSLKNSKSAGFDRLINEYIKNCPSKIIDIITKFFNLVLETGVVPNDWCLGMIQPIYKGKGDESDPDNYRGITLLSCMGKLFTSCINDRLGKYMEDMDLMNECQAGFREGYSTIDHIYVLNSIIDFYLHHKKKIYACFVDYRKAFDSVDRVSLWGKLLSTGINGKILTVIKNLYSNAKSCIKSGNKVSDFFSCNVGVRQGDNLSPLLFAIYLNDFESFLANTYNGLNFIADELNTNLTDLDTYFKLFLLLYADDTVILAESETELQSALNALENYCYIWQLEVNLTKTKIIIFSRGKIRKHRVFMFAGDVVQVVDDYIYLGVKFNYNNTFTKAIDNQLALARKAMFALLSRCQNLQLPLEITTSLFDKLVVPVLVYGCEIWGYSKLDKIELFHRKFLKQVLSVSKFTANAMVYGELGRVDIKSLIHSRMLNYWHKMNAAEPRKKCAILYKFIRNQYEANFYKSKWCSKIHNILCDLGLPNVWNHNGYSLNKFKSMTKLRLNDAFIQHWYSDISNNRLCINYRIFKTQFSHENYFNYLDSNLRVSYTKFRCGSHLLPISISRYNEISDRNLCPLCLSDIGDEYHYILTCPAFDHVRVKYLQRNIYTNPNTNKFCQLFSSQSKPVIVQLCKFIKIILFVFRA